MVSLFKEKKSTVALRLIVLSVVVHVRFFTAPPVVVMPGSESLLYYILAPLQQLPSILVSLLYHAIIIVQALRLNYLLHHYRMFSSQDYTPAMSYILLTALFPAWNSISPALILIFFLLLWIHLFILLINTQKPAIMLFDCGIVAGIMVMLYPAAAVIIVAGLLAMLILRSFRLNEVCIYFIGIIIPLYFLGSILFLNNHLPWMKNLIPHFNYHISFPTDKFTAIISFALILAYTLFGIVIRQNHSGKLVISARKLWIIITLTFVLLSAYLLFSAGQNWPLAMLLPVPFCAALCANIFYYNHKKIFISILFWLLLIACIFNSFGGIALLKK